MSASPSESAGVRAEPEAGIPLSAREIPVSPAGADSGSRPELLAWLVERGALTPVLAERVARVQSDTSDRLSAILLKLGLLSEARLAEALAEFCGLPR